MRRPHWLTAADGPEALPGVDAALADPNGLLAVGGSLEPRWLLFAYRRGVFPWYEQGQPILWWSPDPRAVLWPEDLHVARSLRRGLRQRRFAVTADRAFAAVVDACAGPRRYTRATWITPMMAAAYNHLHELGHAHSFEAWDGERLVGGLYGVALGRVFFGESMFAHATDASKFAFVKGVEFLRERNCALIDCQVPSSHLTSLGATSLARQRFVTLLDELCEPAGEPGSWAAMMGRR